MPSTIVGSHDYASVRARSAQPILFYFHATGQPFLSLRGEPGPRARQVRAGRAAHRSGVPFGTFAEERVRDLYYADEARADLRVVRCAVDRMFCSVCSAWPTSPPIAGPGRHPQVWAPARRNHRLSPAILQAVIIATSRLAVAGGDARLANGFDVLIDLGPTLSCSPACALAIAIGTTPASDPCRGGANRSTRFAE